VAEDRDRIIGFLHYVKHEDIIDGGPNTFITAFYVSRGYRGKGIGSRLLERAISDSLEKGVVGVETSTIHRLAKKLYEKHHFKQTMGDIREVFLELDIPEYVKAKKRGRS
jgi:GNAT superfamily N-acetyltransferase